MDARTEGEKLAYVEGYNACYKQFCEYLRMKPFEMAMTAMAYTHFAVNAIVEKEGEKDDN